VREFEHSSDSMLRRVRQLGEHARRLSSISTARPAICAVQLAPRPGVQSELHEWLHEGRTLLEKSLHTRRPADIVPKASIIGTDIKSCYHWIHIPANHNESRQHDTVAIVFTRTDDLHLWRSSEERSAWLDRGYSLAANSKSILVDAERITLQRDDGSLGGWLPSRDGSGVAETSVPPPPPWKVAATVLLPMFCMQDLNRTVIHPILNTLEIWSSLPASVQLFLTCAWTTGTVTMVLLPPTRTIVEKIGFIGGSKGCPELKPLFFSSALIVSIYVSLVTGSVLLSAPASASRSRSEDDT